MNSADVSATVESSTANDTASPRLSFESPYFRVCTIDECRYRLCGITVAPRMWSTGLAFSTTFSIDRRVMASNYAEGGLYSSADRGTTWTHVWDGWLLLGKTLSSFAIDFVRNHTGPPMAVATKNFSQIGFTSDFGVTWRVLAIPNMPDVSQAAVSRLSQRNKCVTAVRH